jgi:hypothetical protein
MPKNREQFDDASGPPLAPPAPPEMFRPHPSDEEAGDRIQEPWKYRLPPHEGPYPDEAMYDSATFTDEEVAAMNGGDLTPLRNRLTTIPENDDNRWWLIKKLTEAEAFFSEKEAS